MQLEGILSYGLTCDYSGVFLKVSGYIDWLKETMKEIIEKKETEKMEKVQIISRTGTVKCSIVGGVSNTVSNGFGNQKCGTANYVRSLRETVLQNGFAKMS